MKRLGAILLLAAGAAVLIWSFFDKTDQKNSREEILEKAREAKRLKSLQNGDNQEKEPIADPE